MKWVLIFEGEKPLSLNKERKQHWAKRAEHVALVRQAFAALARKHKVPKGLDHLVIAALPLGVKGDAGNHYPTVKASIDGLIDAGVIEDDSPKYVVSIIQHAPNKDAPPGLALTIFHDDE